MAARNRDTRVPVRADVILADIHFRCVIRTSSHRERFDRWWNDIRPQTLIRMLGIDPEIRAAVIHVDKAAVRTASDFRQIIPDDQVLDPVSIDVRDPEPVPAEDRVRPGVLSHNVRDAMRIDYSARCTIRDETRPPA